MGGPNGVNLKILIKKQLLGRGCDGFFLTNTTLNVLDQSYKMAIEREDCRIKSK
jgi:hypothetical protein